MTFEEIKQSLISGQKVSRKNWGNGSKVFYLQVDEAYRNDTTTNPLDHLSMYIKEDGDVEKKMLWTDDFKDTHDDWYVFNDEKFIPQGWQCPRCGKICSPYTTTCDCTHDIFNECNHVWAMKTISGPTTTGIKYEYECLNCGAIKTEETCEFDEDSTSSETCEHTWYLTGIETVNDYKVTSYKCEKCKETKIISEPPFQNI